MAKFILYRIRDAVPVLLLLTLLVFGLFKLIPGDYLSSMELNPTVSKERIEELRRSYGLDQSLPVQYGLWMRNALLGDFGYSFSQRRPASQLIRERFGATLLLAFGALLLTLVISLPLGIVSALFAGRWPDRMSLALSMAGLSLPTVLSALGCLYFAYWSGWFPVGGSDTFLHAVLPCVTLAIPSVALFLRTLRLELLDALAAPYVLAAAARGLPRRRIIWHALRNAANPIISLTGVTLGGLLSGAVVVEKVFSWPGLGSLTVDSILARDLYVALGCVFVSAVLVIVANLAADIVLAWNDPRIRCER